MLKGAKVASVWLGRGLRWILATLLWLVAMVGLTALLGWSPWVAAVLLFLYWGVWFSKWGKPLWMSMAALLACALVVFTITRLEARNDRAWWVEFQRLPKIEIDSDKVTIRDLRNFQWRKPDDFDPVWEDREVDLSLLSTLELIVEPFEDSEFAAHTMLDFGFSDGQQIIISAETRKEEGEQYSLLAGACRQFELIYVIGDERDFLTLRGVARRSRVYAYPIRCDHSFRKELFLSLVKAANALHDEPRFYASLQQNCTTTLAQHIDRVRPEDPIGWQKGTLFPAQSGELIWDIGRLETTAQSYEEAQEQCRIDDRIREHSGAADFSRKIREKKQ